MTGQQERPRPPALVRLAEAVAVTGPGAPLRVGIDGITAAGKTTVARTLTALIEELGRPSMHVSADGFHNLRAERHSLADPARSYLEHAYDVTSIVEQLLAPLGPGGDRSVRTAVMDLESDRRLASTPTTVAEDVVLVFDGTFLARAELRLHWDALVLVETDPAVAVERAVRRDGEAMGGPKAVREAMAARYHAACALYLARDRPERVARWILGNDDPSTPVLRERR